MANQQPASIRTQQLGDIFPAPANMVDIATWFNFNVPPNPFHAVVPDATPYTFVNPTPWRSGIGANAPFAQGWNDNQSDTMKRERTYFLVNQGDHAAYHAQNNRRGASPLVPIAATVNGTNNPHHWLFRVGGRMPNINRPLQVHMNRYLDKVGTDSRGALVRVATTFWNELGPPPTNSPWHTAAQQPGRLVRILLYFLRETPHRTPGIVLWLLGDRLRTHFDANALYTAVASNVPLLILDPATNQPVDLVAALAGWVEFLCAHVLTEVFMNYFVVRPATKASKTMLRRNVQWVAMRYPHRALLESCVHLFPYRGDP